MKGNENIDYDAMYAQHQAKNLHLDQLTPSDDDNVDAIAENFKKEIDNLVKNIGVVINGDYNGGLEDFVRHRLWPCFIGFFNSVNKLKGNDLRWSEFRDKCKLKDYQDYMSAIDFIRKYSKAKVLNVEQFKNAMNFLIDDIVSNNKLSSLIWVVNNILDKLNKLKMKENSKFSLENYLERFVTLNFKITF